MSDRVIDSPLDLGLQIDKIIAEALKGGLHDATLDEKEKQDAVVDLFGDGGDDSSGEEKQQSSSDDSSDDQGDQEDADKSAHDQESLEKSEVKLSDVVDKLNIIRSGRSLKDSSVKQNMEKYVQGLSSTERVALLAFLKGIGQILTGEIPAQQAIDPTKDPADVHMHKNDAKGKETHHVKPNVIKKSAGGDQPEKKTAGEDTTPPVPISPKRKK